MKLTDQDVQDMISGKKENSLLRQGMCGVDVSKIDMSKLSFEMFQFLSFNTKTKFSDEQKEKFQIEKLISKGKMKQNGGEGVKVAIIDSAMDANHVSFQDKKLEYVYQETSGTEEEHGITVLSSFFQVAPKADVTYYANNKYNKDKEKNFCKYMRDVVKRGDIKIISMSASFKNKDIEKEVQDMLKENQITLIDSKAFYKDFSYYISTVDEKGNDSFHNGYCEFEEKKGKTWIGENKRRKQKEDSILEDIEDKRKGNAQVQCGGKVFAQSDNNYKYCGYCCASFSIPQVAGLFALAREKDPNLSYENFVLAVKETSDIIPKDGIENKVVNEERLLEKVLTDKDKVATSEFTKELNEQVHTDLESEFGIEPQKEEKNTEVEVR
ncbi:MAG: hypothetical protein PHP54_01280 [Clostridia bacterium]|nr:hypothetical protein [Clostridia bacterium]